MKEGNYKIIMTIYEAQELEPKKADLFGFVPMNKSAVDAFVEIEVLGQKRKTAVKWCLCRCVRRRTTRFGSNHFISN